MVPAAANARQASGASRSASASSKPRSSGKMYRAQPGQQVEPGAEAGIRDLRQVGMEVDHPGHDHPRAEVEGAAAASSGRSVAAPA